MSIEITKPTVKDIKHLLPLCKQQCNYHHKMDSHYYADASPESNQEYKELIQKSIIDNDPNILIAKDGSAVIGFMTYSIVDNNYADTNIKKYGYIQELIIDEAHRSQGVGALLMKAAEQFFQREGINEVSVSTSAANTSAIQFFQKQGYETRRLYMFKNIEGSPDSE